MGRRLLRLGTKYYSFSKRKKIRHFFFTSDNDSQPMLSRRNIFKRNMKMIARLSKIRQNWTDQKVTSGRFYFTSGKIKVANSSVSLYATCKVVFWASRMLTNTTADGSVSDRAAGWGSAGSMYNGAWGRAFQRPNRTQYGKENRDRNSIKYHDSQSFSKN